MQAHAGHKTPDEGFQYWLQRLRLEAISVTYFPARAQSQCFVT